MIIDVLLGAVALASIGFILHLLRKKAPQLAHINVKATPEHRQATIKRQILEEKLKRDLSKRWRAFRDSFLLERKNALAKFFGRLYEKMKELEQEYKLTRRKALSQHVAASRSMEEQIAAARQYLSEQQYSRAEQTLIETLKIDEHNARVYVLLAQVYKAQGDYDHAKQTLEYVLRLTNSEDASIYGGLAGLARERGDLKAAQEEYMKSISLDPKNHTYYLELAEVHHALGDYERAKEAAQKAIALAPNNPKILDFLIENSILLQDKTRAAAYLEKLIVVNPENGKIKSFRERLLALGE